MKNKISILGCGWLGFALAKKLVSMGHPVNGSVRSEEKSPHLTDEKICAFRIDISDTSASLPDAFFDCEKMVVCIPEKNISAHRHLVERLGKSSVRQIIFTSSTSVYENINGTVTEDSILRDVPLAHIEEVYLNAKIPTTILRLGGLFGPDRHPGRFFQKRKNAILTQAPTNLIHQSDVIDAILYFLKKESEQNTYNITSDEHPPKFDFYSAAYEDYYGEKAQFILGEGSGGKVVSNEKLRKEMVWDFPLKYGER